MITQRLVNRFPSWTKIRKDPSSFGHRVLSVVGEHFDFAHSEIKQNHLAYALTKKGLGLDELWFIELGVDDYMLSTASPGGLLSWSYPTVTGLDGVTTRSVQQVESLEEFYWSVPNRISLYETFGLEYLTIFEKAYQAAPVIYNMDIPSHLHLLVDASTDWYKRTSLKNPFQPGIHRILINGYDLNSIEITESIDVIDDGYVWTENIFSEVLDVWVQGFNGAVIATAFSSKSTMIDPYHLAVSSSKLDGPLYLDLSHNLDSATSEISMYTPLVKFGEEYRDGVDELGYNKEIIWHQSLRDSSGASIELVDFTINPNTTRLYAIDTVGDIHIYEYTIGQFEPPSLESTMTKATYIDIEATQPWAVYGETLMMSTRFSRPRFPVVSVEIKRISPLGTTNYLQSDKTWSGVQYSWPGDPNAVGLFEGTFQEVFFTCEFNEFGQWEFYATTTTIDDVTVSYTGVMVDVQDALASFSTGITSPLALNYSPDNYLAITKNVTGPGGESNTVYKYKEHSDVYLADEENQTIYLREEYSSITVS